MKYQVVCPKCKHEFRYDEDYYARQIAALQKDIGEMVRQLSEYKTWSPYKKREWAGWRSQLINRLEQKKAELNELKIHRQTYHEHLSQQNDVVFCRLVKEFIGREKYAELREKADEELAAYNIADMMKRDYTRAGGRNITSYGKTQK